MENLQPLTVVLPSKNHERSISINLESLYSFLEKHFIDFQILIISNGSSKENTNLLNSKIFKNKKIDLVIFESKGKGHAIKYGLKNSKYDHVLLFDSDFSYDVELISKVYKNNFPIAPFVYARRVINKNLFSTLSLIRYVAGIIFNFSVRNYLKINSKDTQAGFKFINKLQFKECIEFISNDYLYDVELFLLSNRHNIETKEINVYSLNAPLGSNINIIRDSLIMIKNLYKIKKHHLG